MGSADFGEGRLRLGLGPLRYHLSSPGGAFNPMRSVLGVLGSFLVATFSAWAQAPFPPTALSSAQSFEAATAAVGATKPEFSSYLLLDVPEVSVAGTIHARIRSELPGTTHLIVLRQFPVMADATTSGQRRAESAQKRPTSRPPTTPARPPTVLIAARQFANGERPQFEAEFQFNRNERFTLLAFAQGRWFGAAREIKLAREVSDPSDPASTRRASP